MTPRRDRFLRWCNRQVCRLKGHDLVERVEHGWPRFRVCTRCPHMEAPDPNPGVAPPDEHRGRTRDTVQFEREHPGFNTDPRLLE